MLEIFDGHNDAVNHMLEYKSGGRDFLERSGEGHLDLPRARAGGMIGGLFAMYVYPETAPVDDLTVSASGYEVRMADPLDPAYARGEVARQLAALKELEQRSSGAIRIATSVDELERARSVQQFSMVLHIEGAEAIGADLSGLEALYSAGLRSVGLVWSRPNAFGHGVPFAFPRSPDTGPGLTAAGKELVRACNHLGIQLDLAHLNEQGFRDVARRSEAPLVVSHSCAYAICPAARNLTDGQLDTIRDSDGLVGVNFSVCDVRPDGRLDADTPLAMVARHVQYLADRVGIDRVALGSDFDGATIPQAVGDVSGLQHFFAALRLCGFDDAALRKIGHENWFRVLRCSIG